ncbi:FeoA family protein [Parasphaerochaeta coccoides]|uniref:FeoA family protein n=1 Tax=Parasphaerochaeta coccoides (strain ATCC BAA-1237 / DSM 17374 / SPN1) TaxID=760011 RepID=F4GIQ0_PARC1|nr:ferrous iron transport protein A [Parasphaerochaeta coccoides]AEC02184.1 FeoA family protein [Parasphaerochaeta coccoides DSM 17374]
MTLDQVSAGETVSVARLNGVGAVKRRIMDMGLTKGVAVTVRRLAPLGDPVELTVRGYELSIRLSEAKLIDVVGQENCK